MCAQSSAFIVARQAARPEIARMRGDFAIQLDLLEWAHRMTI